MVVRRDAPSVGDRFEHVGLTVSVFVSHSSDFAPLRRVQPSVTPSETKWFMQASGEKRKLVGADFRCQRIANAKNIATTAAHGKRAIWHPLKSTGFDHLADRGFKTRDLVVVRLFC